MSTKTTVVFLHASTVKKTTVVFVHPRRSALTPPARPARGYERLYPDRARHAHLGCDFDFLRHESLGPAPS
jgi:hypothetical protein